MAIPIIRLELEHAKEAILVAITERMVKMDADIRTAVENVCTPQFVKATLESTVKKVLQEAVDAEVKGFFLYGEGRKHVKNAINKKLSVDPFGDED